MEVNHSIDTRRETRQQEKVIVETSSLMLTAARPIFQYQRATIRLWADIFDGWIRTCEQLAEMTSYLLPTTTKN